MRIITGYWIETSTSCIYKICKILFIVSQFSIIGYSTAYGQKHFPTISYLKIAVDSMGNLKQNPLVLKFNSVNRSLTVIGTQHAYDTLSTVFTIIEEQFNNLQPQVIINEGGNLTKHYSSRNAAITENAELGLEKYLADNAGIKTINGDISENQEFLILSKKFSRRQVLFYFATERFIFPYKFGVYKGDLEKLYQSNFIKGYLIKEGIKLSPGERTFKYYKQIYRQYFGKKFRLSDLDQHDYTPFGTGSHFNNITRSSKEIQDQHLLNILAESTHKYTRILLVFGGWHILVIEPSLKLITDNKNFDKLPL